jgi:hypothetical protein
VYSHLFLLAQVVGTPRPVLGWILVIVVPLVVAALIYLIAQLSLWAGAKAKGSKYENFVAIFASKANAVVAYVITQMKPEILDAVKDGQVTAEERKTLLEHCMARFKAALGDQGLDTAAKVFQTFGPGLEQILGGFLSHAIESFIGKALAGTAAPALPDATALASAALAASSSTNPSGAGTLVVPK